VSILLVEIVCFVVWGDALYFHSNVLHTSDKNDSDLRRWAFLCAYNRADNDPVYKHHHPNYTPLSKVNSDSLKWWRDLLLLASFWQLLESCWIMFYKQLLQLCLSLMTHDHYRSCNRRYCNYSAGDFEVCRPYTIRRLAWNLAPRRVRVLC